MLLLDGHVKWMNYGGLVGANLPFGGSSATTSP